MTDRSVITHLPSHLEERTRPLSAKRPCDGTFVLYWMRTAVRGHENPALDVALATARHLGVPVFVYHGVAERYRYASDRLHTFILEGARDVQRELVARRIGYACHVERPGHRGKHLIDLARRASVIVTEEMPVPPFVRWTDTLSRCAQAPVWSIDTSCVVPMRLVGQAWGRAYKFRDATKDLLADRVHRPWPEQPDPDTAFTPRDLPFSPIDPAAVSIPDLVAQCEIDHTVGPVWDTPGGSQAGYRRWRAFCERDLDRYHRRRNDPTAGGSSRMSGYLHFGHVSPLRLARQAHLRGSDGADKFIDELVTWRELSYTFCFYNRHRDLESSDVLPEWAQDTLRTHETDPRPAIYDWETLARGRTEDSFWNLLQHSLLAHGELHNNVRMTWGKALLKWAPDAQRALAMAFDLNHRYALDGRDPNSYQGILWCFGHFDRPFEPPRPIFGRVRPRDTDWHASRVSLPKYRDLVHRPVVTPRPRVAVIGAGLAGLTCARTLHDHRLDVQVFDKGRGPGGRMATRRVDDPATRFDHGAQYFTARDARFERAVHSWIDAGHVAPWEAKIGTFDGASCAEKPSPTARFVGVPGMNAVCKHMARDLNVLYRHRITRIRRDADKWWLITDDGLEHGAFDHLVVTAPPPQTADLLAPVLPELASRVADVQMRPCWAVMASFDSPLPTDLGGVFVNDDGPLAWAARNSTRPGRSSDRDTWVLHATPEWSHANIELERPAVEEILLGALRDVFGPLPSPAPWTRAHRWRYALAASPLDEGALLDRASGLVACGDWSAGDRVEGAYLAGCAAAGRILGILTHQKPQPQLQLI